MNKKIIPFLVLTILTLLNITSFASVYINHPTSFIYQDGTEVLTIINGGKYYAETESHDGYTLLFNPNDRRYYYAILSEDGDSFISSGAVYLGVKPPAQLKLSQHLHLPQSVIDKKIREAQQLETITQQLPHSDSTLFSATSVQGATNYKSGRLTVGDIRGLTIIIDFPDEPGTITKQQVENYLNKEGYSEFGNKGSIRDYFRKVSNGKLNYTNDLLGYYTAPNNKSYYTSGGSKTTAKELVTGALQHFYDQGYDFSKLPTNKYNGIKAINIFYAGNSNSPWNTGLAPHQGYVKFLPFSNGFSAYQVTPMKNALTIGMFIHESSHMIAGFPDLYDTNFDSKGTGFYDVMGYTADPKNPGKPNPFYREIAGWDTSIELNPAINANAPTGSLSDTAHDAISYKYTNPDNLAEIFYIEAGFQDDDGDTQYPDTGLIIWHIDDKGKNIHNAMTPDLHYRVSLEQADGRFDLEKNKNNGDSGDLFHKNGVTTFNDHTVPNANWWNGDHSSLNITDVGPIGKTMCFTLDSGTCNKLIQPKIAISLTTSDITQSSFTLNWANTASAESYQIQFFNDLNNRWNTVKKTTATHYTLTGLAAGSTQKVRVRASNSDGSSTYSSSVQVTMTKAEIIPAKPTGLHTSNITGSSFKLRWSPTPNAVQYQVQRWHKKAWQLVATTIDTYYIHTDLAPTTTYFSRIRATNTAGNSPYSTYVYADTTKETCVTMQPPHNLHATDITQTSFSMNWNITGETSHYTGVHFQRLKDGKVVDFSSGSGTTHTFSSLHKSHKYIIRLAATNNCKPSAYTDWFTVQLIDKANGEVPKTPEKMVSSNVTNSSYILSWQAVANANQYQVQQYDNDSGWKTIDTISNTSYHFQNLKFNSDQMTQVRAINQYGNSAYSSYMYIRIKRPKACHSAPYIPKLSTLNRSNTSFTASWSELATATHYDLQLWDKQTSTWKVYVTTSTSSLKLINLTLGKKHLRVRANNTCGASAYSDWITVE